MSKSISTPNIDKVAQSTAVITTFDLRKRTSAILELYFRFRIYLLIVTYGYWHLHWRTKFEVSTGAESSGGDPWRTGAEKPQKLKKQQVKQCWWYHARANLFYFLPAGLTLYNLIAVNINQTYRPIVNREYLLVWRGMAQWPSHKDATDSSDCLLRPKVQRLWQMVPHLGYWILCLYVFL